MTELRNLSTDEHKMIGDIIGDSFADDPVNRWVFGGESGLSDYYSMVAKKLYLKNGYGHVMDNGSGGTLWLPPGVKKYVPLWNSIDIAASMVKHGGISSIVRGIAVDEFLVRKKPTEPHYYLFAIGTRPSYQGKGIGGKLMEAGLEQANAKGMPAYLESSKKSNIPFYRKFGFEVIEEVIPAKGCPPLWLMWREG